MELPLGEWVMQIESCSKHPKKLSREKEKRSAEVGEGSERWNDGCKHASCITPYLLPGFSWTNRKRQQDSGRIVHRLIHLNKISHQLPFVYEFISERVSWLPLHDIWFSFFVGEWNGRHLRLKCCKKHDDKTLSQINTRNQHKYKHVEWQQISKSQNKTTENHNWVAISVLLFLFTKLEAYCAGVAMNDRGMCYSIYKQVRKSNKY